jgi:hypothetical protein
MRPSPSALKSFSPSPAATLRAAALVIAMASSAFLGGCAKTVQIQPDGPFLGTGAYRSQTVAATGGHTYRLELKRDGRYVLKDFASGCLVREDKGVWSASEEYLDLEAREVHARAACDAPLLATARPGTYTCPIRKMSDKAFQMIHEEINQGTQWTEWTLARSGDFAEASSTPGELSAAR